MPSSKIVIMPTFEETLQSMLAVPAQAKEGHVWCRTLSDAAHASLVASNPLFDPETPKPAANAFVTVRIVWDAAWSTERPLSIDLVAMPLKWEFSPRLPKHTTSVHEAFNSRSQALSLAEWVASVWGRTSAAKLSETWHGVSPELIGVGMFGANMTFGQLPPTMHPAFHTALHVAGQRQISDLPLKEIAGIVKDAGDYAAIYSNGAIALSTSGPIVVKNPLLRSKGVSNLGKFQWIQPTSASSPRYFVHRVIETLNSSLDEDEDDESFLGEHEDGEVGNELGDRYLATAFLGSALFSSALLDAIHGTSSAPAVTQGRKTPRSQSSTDFVQNWFKRSGGSSTDRKALKAKLAPTNTDPMNQRAVATTYLFLGVNATVGDTNPVGRWPEACWILGRTDAGSAQEDEEDEEQTPKKYPNKKGRNKAPFPRNPLAPRVSVVPRLIPLNQTLNPWHTTNLRWYGALETQTNKRTRTGTASTWADVPGGSDPIDLDPYLIESDYVRAHPALLVTPWVIEGPVTQAEIDCLAKDPDPRYKVVEVPSSTFAPMRNFGWDESRKINFLGAASWHSMIDASQAMHIASGSFGTWESQPCLSGMWGMIQMFGTEVNSWKVLVLGSTRSEVGQRSFPYSTLPPARVLPEWRDPASFRLSEKVESVFGFFANYEEGIPEENRVYMPIGVDELMRGSCVDLPWPLTRGLPHRKMNKDGRTSDQYGWRFANFDLDPSLEITSRSLIDGTRKPGGLSLSKGGLQVCDHLAAGEAETQAYVRWLSMVATMTSGDRSLNKDLHHDDNLWLQSAEEAQALEMQKSAQQLFDEEDDEEDDDEDEEDEEEEEDEDDAGESEEEADEEKYATEEFDDDDEDEDDEDDDV